MWESYLVLREGIKDFGSYFMFSFAPFSGMVMPFSYQYEVERSSPFKI